MRPQGLLDARVLVWLLALVIITGIPLALWFDADASAHRDAMAGQLGLWLRAAHSAASVLLVIGMVGHFIVRTIPGSPARAPSSRRGRTTGALAFAATALAATSGALAAQTPESRHILAHLGAPADVAGVEVALALFHIALASLLVAVAVYLHLAGRRRTVPLEAKRPALAALAFTSAAAIAGSYRHLSIPGDTARWQGTTWLLAPPVPILWAWPLLAAAAAVAWVLARRRTNRV